ncbi:MAG: energy-coupling factor ABC transporter substrate-binding protein [Syntrophomonadaceae bacterium]|jgi:cobalt/nickel transport protein
MKRNAILIVIMLALVVYALYSNQGAEFGGADSQAKAVIAELSPGYEPWFESIWEPPSGEVESLLFALQAALGTGFICYYIGYCIGRNKGRAQS